MPPHSDGAQAPNPRLHPAEAELLVVGAMLLVEDCILDVVDICQAADFHLAPCRMLYEALVAVHERRVAVDFITVGQELTNRGQLGAVGGQAFLVEVTGHVTSAAHAKHHAQLVAECAQLRAANRLCLELAQEARDSVRPGQEGEVSGYLEEAERRLFEVAARDLERAEANAVPAVMAELFAHLENPQEHGLATGLGQLDDLLLGFRPGELIILAARPGKGKTTLAMNIALNLAAAGRPGMFVSLEMSQLQLAQRLMARESGVHGYNLRRGHLGMEDLQAVHAAAERMGEWPLTICDAAEMTPARLRALARRVRNRGGLQWLMVDYLQLMSYPPASNSRVQEVSYISRGLKLLAKEMGMPLVAISQLSRAAEEAPRPKLHHLRESGTLEQDADIVGLMWQEDEEGPVSLDIAKNRHGATGKLDIAWRKATYHMTGLAAGTGAWGGPD